MIVRAPRAAAAVALFLLPLATACGRTGAPADVGPDGVLARNALPGLVGRRCDFASPRDEIPAFSRVSRLGTRGNISLWGFRAEPSDSVVVSVRYDEDGRLAWVRAIQSSVPTEAVASLERLLLESMNERGPADWGVRLEVVAGDLAGLDPSVICPAEIRSGGGPPTVSLPTTEREFRALERARGRRFRVQITIDELGRTVDVRLPRSSGESVVDQFLMDWVRATHFQPKLHDGIAVATTIEQIIYIPRRR